PCPRYVSRARLATMLDHEYGLLLERLDATVGQERTFFVFANTVAARSFRLHDECHGWMGIRFQRHPRAPYNEIIAHVRLFDSENLLQQEALGILGVNLIHAAYYNSRRPESVITALTDDLRPGRIGVDMIRFSGPEFAGVDNRLMALHLVTSGLAQAALFRADGEVVNAADAFYKKPLLIERGSFRPVTLLTNDMLDRALEMFLRDEQLEAGEPEILMEITMKNLLAGGSLDMRDFLDRVDMLGALGRTVLISQHAEFYRLVRYLRLYTGRPIGLPLGVPALAEIFTPEYYAELEGGMLEALGRLFKNNVRLYVYPLLKPDGSQVTAANFETPPGIRHLYAYLLENQRLRSLEGAPLEILKIRSKDVIAKIRSGDESWREMVPPEVARIISSRRLFAAQP
ncbi:MAG: hypothetical protein N2322_03035, partial [Terrimicrobiaceae bacterium]|nr:hypothetical protein [Terrimicrobiaceae bacterium]